MGHSKVIGIYEWGSDSDFKNITLGAAWKWVEKHRSWEFRWKHGDPIPKLL